MRLLILGGTRFVGRYIVEAARAREHEVTLFNRGQSNPDLFPDVEQLRGDRDGDLSALEGKSWDAVVDTSGYVPRVVRASAELLAPYVQHYAFVSSISVYVEPFPMNADEDAPLATMEDETVEEITSETYGALKVLCEQVVADVYPDAALIIRPGLIVGPHDPTDRFTYWPVRIARGGEVIAPKPASKPVQFIDVRDLAIWTISMVEKAAIGIYNATGPDERLKMGDVLANCREVTRSLVRFVWVDEDFLLAHNVQPWRELPLWVPGEEGNALGSVNVQKAISAGLTFRALEETIADTLEWAGNRPDNHQWRAGLKPDREQALVEAWYEHEQS